MTYTALATHTMKHENVLAVETQNVKDDMKSGIQIAIVTTSESNLALSLSNWKRTSSLQSVWNKVPEFISK